MIFRQNHHLDISKLHESCIKLFAQLAIFRGLKGPWINVNDFE
ncbi:unnamed protein product [Acidithrix sp. C25]|nr:unnamed protein product [Acidithrix sp. C25]